MAWCVHRHEPHHDVGLADDRKSGEQPADDEEDWSSSGAGCGVRDKPAHVIRGHGVERCVERRYASEVGDGDPAHDAHRSDHQERLRGICPDGCPNASGEAVQQHDDRAQSGTDTVVPAEEHEQCFAASVQLRGRIRTEEEYGQHATDSLQATIVGAVPSAQHGGEAVCVTLL